MSFIEFFFLASSSSFMVNQSNGCSSSSSIEDPSGNNLKPLDLSHGQCSWCGKYGHNRVICPLLK